MKFTVLFSVVLAGAISAVASATTFECKIDAEYKIFDVPNDPLTPTNTEKNWAALQVRKSYNKAHNSDYNDMTVNAFQSLSSSPNTGNSFEEVTNAMESEAEVNCDGGGCSINDDDALALAVNLENSNTHNRWVAEWCTSMQQSGKLVFEYAYACEITLYDCTLSSPSPNGDAPEIIVDVKPGLRAAVGAGMEAIEAIEAEAEIAAQELHND